MRKYNPKAELIPEEYEELEAAIVEQYAFNEIRIMAAMTKARQEGNKQAIEYFEKLLDTKSKPHWGFSYQNPPSNFNYTNYSNKSNCSSLRSFSS